MATLPVGLSGAGADDFSAETFTGGAGAGGGVADGGGAKAINATARLRAWGSISPSG